MGISRTMKTNKLNIEIKEKELVEILFKRLELKYQGQLERLRKKYKELESLVFSWVRKDREDIDNLKKVIGGLNSSQP